MKSHWLEIGLAVLIVAMVVIFALMSGCVTLYVSRADILPNVRIEYTASQPTTQPTSRPNWEAAIRELR